MSGCISIQTYSAPKGFSGAGKIQSLNLQLFCRAPPSAYGMWDSVSWSGCVPLRFIFLIHFADKERPVDIWHRGPGCSQNRAVRRRGLYFYFWAVGEMACHLWTPGPWKCPFNIYRMLICYQLPKRTVLKIRLSLQFMLSPCCYIGFFHCLRVVFTSF